MARRRRRGSAARWGVVPRVLPLRGPRGALPWAAPLCVLLTLACSAGSIADRSAPPPAAGVTASAPAPPPALRPVKMSFATDSAVSSPLWMAKDLGLFEKYGIDADLVYIRGGA